MGVVLWAPGCHHWTPLLYQRYCVGSLLVYRFHLSSPRYSFWLGIISIPLHMMYPLAKRWLFWPQLLLGKSYVTPQPFDTIPMINGTLRNRVRVERPRGMDFYYGGQRLAVREHGCLCYGHRPHLVSLENLPAANVPDE